MTGIDQVNAETPSVPVLVGYARVSTGSQDAALQRDALLAAGVSERLLFEETASGALRERPILNRCFEQLREGDVLVVYSMSRLGRSTIDVLDRIEQLRAMGVSFRSLTENIDTDSPSGRAFVTIIAALAQMERELLSERTKAGLAARRKAGVKLGRPSKLSPLQVATARTMLAGEPRVTVQEAATVLGVSAQTLYRAFAAEREAAKVAEAVSA